MTELLLAVDTSGKNGSVAVAAIPESGTELHVLETVALSGGTFSAHLMPQVSALLQKHGLTKRELSAFAVISGPGSFTGLRVGLAAIKGLADVLRKPVVAISLLEVLAIMAGTHDRVYSALDAGRGEVYVGDYGLRPLLQRYGERLLRREELWTEARSQWIVTPDAALGKAANEAGCLVQQVEYPHADVIARLGWERIQRGDIVLPEQLEANYIRRSDAEIFSKPTP